MDGHRSSCRMSRGFWRGRWRRVRRSLSGANTGSACAEPAYAEPHRADSTYARPAGTCRRNSGCAEPAQPSATPPEPSPIPKPEEKKNRLPRTRIRGRTSQINKPAEANPFPEDDSTPAPAMPPVKTLPPGTHGETASALAGAALHLCGYIQLRAASGDGARPGRTARGWPAFDRFHRARKWQETDADFLHQRSFRAVRGNRAGSGMPDVAVAEDQPDFYASGRRVCAV